VVFNILGKEVDLLCPRAGNYQRTTVMAEKWRTGTLAMASE